MHPWTVAVVHPACFSRSRVASHRKELIMRRKADEADGRKEGGRRRGDKEELTSFSNFGGAELRTEEDQGRGRGEGREGVEGGSPGSWPTSSEGPRVPRQESVIITQRRSSIPFPRFLRTLRRESLAMQCIYLFLARFVSLVRAPLTRLAATSDISRNISSGIARSCRSCYARSCSSRHSEMGARRLP